MIKKALKKSLAFLVIISIANVFSIFCFSPNQTDAANLINVSDAVSSHLMGADSNHTIKFDTPSGVHLPASTITLTFDSNFNNAGVDFSDIDLSHGPTTGYETEEVLAAVAGFNTWGASFTANILTLTPPTNAGINEIASNDTVIIEIGTNASGGVDMINNPNTAGAYLLYISGGFGDERVIGLSISDTTVGVIATVQQSTIPPGGSTPLIISNVQVINITPYSATVTWDTNRNANSRVDYGLTAGYEIGSTFDGAYVTSHSIDLIGLTPDTLYHFQVVSVAGDGTLASDGDYTFTTLPLAEELIIFNVRAENITAHSADIVWETNHDADSRVDFGLTNSYEIGFREDGTMVIIHTIPLDGLLADTTYYFSVTSSDNFGNTVSSINHSFTTLPEEVFVPNVLNFSADPDVDNVRIILTWQNPIMPDFGGVLIKRSTTGYPATPFDGDFVYNGPDELAYDYNVEFGVIYYYSAFAYNTNGDFASGAFDWAILIAPFTVHIKAWPEKRLPRTGNWDTNGVLAFYTPGTDVITNLYSVDTAESTGEADVLIDDLVPGVYDTMFKGLSHLKKKLYDQSMDPTQAEILDFTLGETFSVLAGDVHMTKDNYVNGLDISATVIALYTADLHADLNQDTQVNGLDLSILVYNLYEWGD